MQFAIPIFVVMTAFSLRAASEFKESNVNKQYAQEWSFPKKAKLELIKTTFQLQGRPAFHLSNPETCGANSCEYSLYLMMADGRVQPILAVTGHLEPSRDWSSIVVTGPSLAVDGAGIKNKTKYIFDPKTNVYQLDKK